MTLPLFTSKTEPCGGENCPTDRLLLELLDGKLSGEQLDRYESLLESCHQCQSRLDRLTDFPRWRAALLEKIQTAATEAQTGDWSHAADTQPRSRTAPAELALVLSGKRFEIRAKIGQGGGGTVFRAHDNVLQREVALKVPHLLTAEDSKRRKRFEIEALATARLNHPNIVPLFDASFAEDSCFLVTEFVPGMSLAEWLTQHQQASAALKIEMILELGCVLADAVEQAHQDSIIHRDLKPSNVLLDTTRTQGTLPFVPRITDFGLARFEQSELPHTASGDVLGSFPYMAPEQIEGDRKSIGPGCDLYALGVILYELATGRLPLNHANPVEMLRMITQRTPTAPRRLRQEIPVDLEAVIMNALEKRPQDRYPTAAALANDLRSLLKGNPVSARRPGPIDQTRRWLRQHPATTLVAGIATVATLIVLATVLVSRWKQTELDSQLIKTNSRLNQTLSETDRLQQLARQKSYLTGMREAGVAWEKRDYAETANLLQPFAAEQYNGLRGIEWHILNQKVTVPSHELTRMKETVYALGLSEDDTLIAATGKESIVRVIRIADAKLIAEWNTDQIEANAVLFDDNDKSLWTTGDDGSIRKWDIATQTELANWDGHGPGHSYHIKHHRDKNWLISGGTDPGLKLWDRDTGELVAHLVADGSENRFADFVVHPKGHLLYTAENHASVRAWDLETFREIEIPISDELNNPTCLRLTADGRTLALASHDYFVKFFDTQTWKMQSVHRFDHGVPRVAIDNVQQIAYGLDRSGRVHQIHLPSAGPPGRDFPANPQTVMFAADENRGFDMRLPADRQSLVTCGKEGTVRQWPLNAVKPETELDFDPHMITSITHSPDGAHLLVVTEPTVFLVDPTTFEVRQQISAAPETQYLFAAALPDNSFIVAARNQPAAVATLSKLEPTENASWGMQKMEASPELPAELTSLTISPDGTRIAYAVDKDEESMTDRLVCRSLEEPEDILFETARQIRKTFGPTASTAALFSDDSQKIVHYADNRLVEWDLTTNTETWRSPEETDLLVCFAGSQRDRWLAGSNAIGELFIWDKQLETNPAVITDLRMHTEAMIFSGDNHTLITGDYVGKLKFWHVPTGSKLYELQLPGAIRNLQLDPQSRHLLVGYGYPHRLRRISISTRP